MLDTVSGNGYNEHMTTTRKRTATYYKVRTAVRFVFWTGVAFFGVVYLGRVVDTAPPKCDIEVNRDFTWDNPRAVDVSKCQQPNNIILKGDGTWEWQQ